MRFTKKLIKKTLRAIGIDRINRVLKCHGVKYELAPKGANQYFYYWRKAKKKIDLKALPEFWEIASIIVNDKKTMLYYDRLYTLWQGVWGIPHSALPIAEIGTHRGGSAKFMLEALKKRGYNSNCYIFDTFEGHVVVDPKLDDRQHIGDFNNVSFEEVKSYLDSSNVFIYRGNFLDTAIHIENIKNFSMVHIDVDVYPVTTFCLEFSRDRTFPGSVIIVDDYGNLSCKGLKKAVDDFVQSNSNFKMFYLLTGQALIIKISETHSYR